MPFAPHILQFKLSHNVVKNDFQNDLATWLSYFISFEIRKACIIVQIILKHFL